MISSVDIKRSYINLYKNMRNYFWDYGTVCDLVDLERCVLTRFPDFEKLRYYASRLEYDTACVRLDDDDMSSAFDDFFSVISEGECGYSYISVNIQD